MSRDDIKMTFLDACTNLIPSDPQTLGLGFKELRIATEVDKLDLWQKLEPLRGKAEDELDQDDWYLDHFLYQSAPRVFYAEHKKEVHLRQTRTPTKLTLPPRWHAPNADIGARLQILPNGLEVSFKGKWRYIYFRL